jgi:hypothetical protein
MREYRFERKFLINHLNAHEVEMLVKFHFAHFTKSYPQRTVNNLYFDSWDYKCLHDNIDGNANRKKFRIRWYGNFTGIIEKPILEIKIKKSLVGTKLSFPLNPLIIDPNFDNNILNKCIILSDIPENYKIELSCMKPFIFNRYRRKYFQSKDKKFRITLDRQLSFYRMGKMKFFSINRNTFSNSTIMELKYSHHESEYADAISSYFPFRMTKSSKYVSGVTALYGVNI